jgi:hypothetical protein
MHPRLFKRFAIALLFTVGSVRSAMADSIEEIAAQIQYDQTHIQPVESEVLKERHMAQMREDMHRLDAEIASEKEQHLKDLSSQTGGFKLGWAMAAKSR